MKKVMRLISKTIVDVGLPHLVRNDDQFEVRLPRPACAGLAMTSVDRRDDDVRGRNDKRRGFSLIELMVVVSIIAVLATVGMVSYRSANARARDSRRVSDAEQVRVALEMYRTDNAGYPVCSSGVLGSCIPTPPLPPITNYINPIPTDPQSPTRQYMFVSTATTYTITVWQERTSSDITFTQPL